MADREAKEERKEGTEKEKKTYWHTKTSSEIVTEARSSARPGPGMTAAPDARGTGLGLAIARGFVEANAGTLTIDDAPGGGTCMRIVLPSLKVTEEVPA